MRVQVACCYCGPRASATVTWDREKETDPTDIQTPEGWLLIYFESTQEKYAYCPDCCCPDCTRSLHEPHLGDMHF